MPRANLRKAILEVLENRTLLSSAMHVMGYAVDFALANGNAVLSENSSGTVNKDSVDWAGLTQVNYFSALTDSSGTIQSTSDSGDTVVTQLDGLVTDATSHGVPVWLTIGGGDTAAINDWNALLNNTSAFGTFAQNLESFCTDPSHVLAGVDFDWEPTAQGGPVTTTEIENFGTLIQTVKTDDPNLLVSAETLGDPLSPSDSTSQAYTIDSTAVKYLDAINVEAYPVTSYTTSNTIMGNWITYVTGGVNQYNVLNTTSNPTPVVGNKQQLQYGIDISSDDTSNSAANAIEDKTDYAAQNQLGGLFLFYLQIDTGSPSVISRINTELGNQTGSLSGSVTTTGGTGIANVTVYLDGNNNGTLDPGEFRTVTNSSGDYLLSNVPPGSYTIRQIIPSGDTQTTPASNAGIPVTIAIGSNLTSENFVDSTTAVPPPPTPPAPPPPPATGSVNGTVTIADGTPLEGITIYLDANNNGQLDSGELSTTTNFSGVYSFPTVPDGSYVIRQVVPSADTQTTPANNGGYAITVTTGSSTTGDNFIDTIPQVPPPPRPPPTTASTLPSPRDPTSLAPTSLILSQARPASLARSSSTAMTIRFKITMKPDWRVGLSTLTPRTMESSTTMS